MVYTDAEEDALVVLNVIPSVFSFIGASFIIGNYYLFEDLRSFAFKLVLFVAIGDVINSIGNFMGSPPLGFLCDFQGFITQLGDLTSFGWVTAIAWTIYTIFNAKEPPTIEDANRWYKRMHIIIWTATGVLSLLPLTTGSYGPSGGLCWIEGDDAGEVWRWLCFYVPLWGSIGYMIFVYSKIWNELNEKPKQPANNKVKSKSADSGNANANTTDPNSNNTNGAAAASDKPPQTSVNMEHQPSDENFRESNSQIMNDNAGSSGNVGGSSGDVGGGGANGGGNSGALQRIKWYPVVLFVCYFWATVRRLDELITGSDAPFWLAAIQVFFSALLGTCNAFVYGLSPQIRERDAEYIRSCLGRTESEGGNKSPENNNES